MNKKAHSGMKGICTGTVIGNSPIRTCFWKMVLKLDTEGSRLFSTAIPGQFAEFDLSGAPLPPMDSISVHLRDKAAKQILLRRPFSFSDVCLSHSSEGSYAIAEILYCVLGPATLRMTSLKTGDTLSILGPLGNGFSIPEDLREAILVIGGMGAPPILHLAHYLKQKHPGIEITAFVGAKTFDALPFQLRIGNKTGIIIEDFEQLAVPVHLSTDDGSAGSRGLITETLERWLENNPANSGKRTIYACGPEAMLAACAEIARRQEIPCQVSMERRMACGIGLCQSCAVQVQSENQDSPVYRLCCQDGPVFNGQEVLFKNDKS